MKLKPVPARKVIKVLIGRYGYRPKRMGAHLVLEGRDGKTVHIPRPKGKHRKKGGSFHGKLDIGQLSKILKDAKIDRDEFLRALDSFWR